MYEISLNELNKNLSLIELNMSWKPDANNIDLDFIKTHNKYKSFIFKLMELGSPKKTDYDSIITEVDYNNLLLSMPDSNRDIINKQLKLMEESGIIKKTSNNGSKDSLFVEFEEEYVKKSISPIKLANSEYYLNSIEEIVKTGDIIEKELGDSYATAAQVLIRWLVSSEHKNINLKDCVKLLDDMGFNFTDRSYNFTENFNFRTFRDSETKKSLFIIKLLTESSILERFNTLNITFDINKCANMIEELKKLKDNWYNYCKENKMFI